jgi:hypothetical protein
MPTMKSGLVVYSKTDGHVRSSFEFPVLNNYRQIVDKPTRTGKDGDCSKLDLLLSTSP